MKNRNVCLNDGCIWLTDGVLCCRSCEHARPYAVRLSLAPIPAAPKANADWLQWYRQRWKELQGFYLEKGEPDD